MQDWLEGGVAELLHRQPGVDSSGGIAAPTTKCAPRMYVNEHTTLLHLRILLFNALCRTGWRAVLQNFSTGSRV